MLYSNGGKSEPGTKGFSITDSKCRYGSGLKDLDGGVTEKNDIPVVDSYYDVCLAYALLGLENAGYRVVDRICHSAFLADHSGGPILLIVVLADGDTMVDLTNAGHSVDEIVECFTGEMSFASACSAGLLSIALAHKEVSFDRIRVDAVLSYAHNEGLHDKVIVAHKLGVAYGKDFIETLGGATAFGQGL